MNHKTVVFLGPTLPVTDAEKILAATYLPPAKMGDIYALLGSSTERIILIDGLFHQTASVWHREILAAMENGIEVVGCSSMGALRAAELHTYGMKGSGEIFKWYRDSVIDGDDEVAMLHGEAKHNYLALSEPLVNIRYTLKQAAREKVITESEMASLISDVQSCYYGDRSWQRINNSSLIQSWALEKQEQFKSWIQRNAVNLKQLDAIHTLQACSSETSIQRDEAITITENPGADYRDVGLLFRLFSADQKINLSGKEIIAHFQKNSSLKERYQSRVIKKFFILQWMEQENIQCPSVFQMEHEERCIANADPSMTQPELKRELKNLLNLRWIYEQPLERFGIDSSPYNRFIEQLLPKIVSKEQERQLRREFHEMGLIRLWAESRGVACPTELVQALKQAKPELSNLAPELWNDWALHDWIVEKGPKFFGYNSWSFGTALLRDLQITGELRDVIKTIGENL